MASQVCFVVANTILAHYARWIEHLGGNLTDVGYINGAGVILGLLIRPWLGQWINRYGAKTLWLIGYLVFASSSLANLLLSDIGLPIYLARSGLLAGSAIVFSSGLAYISQIAPENRRAEGIGILGAAGFIGMLLGPYLGDWLLGPKVEGAFRDRAVFTNLFLAASIANIVPIIILLFVRSTGERAIHATTSIRGFFSTIKLHWPGTIVGVVFVFGVCITVPFVFLASYIDETPLVIGEHSVMGLFFLCYGGWGFILRLICRRLPDQVGARKVLLAGMAFMSIGMFAFVLVEESRAWMIVTPALLTGTGHSLIYHSMASLAMEPFPRELHGTGSVLVSITLDSGILIGAAVLGLIGEYLGFNWLFSSIGLACLICAIHFGLSRNR